LVLIIECGTQPREDKSHGVPTPALCYISYRSAGISLEIILSSSAELARMHTEFLFQDRRGNNWGPAIPHLNLTN